MEHTTIIKPGTLHSSRWAIFQSLVYMRSTSSFSSKHAKREVPLLSHPTHVPFIAFSTTDVQYTTFTPLPTKDCYYYEAFSVVAILHKVGFNDVKFIINENTWRRECAYGWIRQRIIALIGTWIGETRALKDNNVWLPGCCAPCKLANKSKHDNYRQIKTICGPW